MTTAPSLPYPSPPEVQSAAVPSVTGPRPLRIIACALCQQRKTRCDRRNPCSSCVKARVACVIVTAAPRRRRRRFPERDLLDRLNKYEGLLRHQGVNFEPLHKNNSQADISSLGAPDGSAVSNESRASTRSDRSNADPSTPRTDTQPVDSSGPKTLWKAINQQFRDPETPRDSSDDESVESTILSAWDQLYGNNDHIFFGSGMAPKNLISLHPAPVHVFRLWQFYLNDVNPLFRITHAPTLQQQIIEASSNLGEISPGMEALMFGMYCAALLPITDEECWKVFAEDKDTLNLRYQSGCQQALVNAGFLRTCDMRVLTGLFLYLLSLRQNMDPRSLSTMIGIAVRIAQRLGLHAESCNKEFSPFEAEMRRRLWWQIVLLDSRVGELANYKVSTLNPAWDCNVPLNVNDADLLPDLKKSPAPREGLTESLFIMLQCEMAHFVRYAQFYLNFVSPFLKSMAKDSDSIQPVSIDELERMMEEKYLSQCDPQNPLQFISSCMSRSLIGKWRLGEHLSTKSSGSDVQQQPPGYREKVMSNAIQMIELDTVIQTSQHIKGFLWFANLYFPFPAYVYLIQELRRSTAGPLVDRAWEAMAVNFEVRKLTDLLHKSPRFRSFSQIFIKAWESRQRALEDMGEAPLPPRFISSIRAVIVAGKQSAPAPHPSPSWQDDFANVGSSRVYSGTPQESGGKESSNIYSSGSASDNFGTDPRSGLEADVDQLGFGPIDWSFMGGIMGDNSMHSSGHFGDGNQGIASMGSWGSGDGLMS